MVPFIADSFFLQSPQLAEDNEGQSLNTFLSLFLFTAIWIFFIIEIPVLHKTSLLKLANVLIQKRRDNFRSGRPILPRPRG